VRSDPTVHEDIDPADYAIVEAIEFGMPFSDLGVLLDWLGSADRDYNLSHSWTRGGREGIRLHHCVVFRGVSPIADAWSPHSWVAVVAATAKALRTGRLVRGLTSIDSNQPSP
jgi:hypothetical protein